MNVREQTSPRRVAIVGAGFTGTALAATLHKLSETPLEIILLDKAGSFGGGFAYSTVHPFHLLNVRAKEMSAFENEPAHFVDWLVSNPDAWPYLDENIADQFVPRFLYGRYLKHFISKMQSASAQVKLTLESAEVIDIIPTELKRVRLLLQDQRAIEVDKVVLALGNSVPGKFPFSVSDKINCIHNPWEYTAPQQISKQATVLIVGTGLSMVDTVLTLYHRQHEGTIYAVSRHGLLPLPHTNHHAVYKFTKELPSSLRELSVDLRAISKQHLQNGGDWREVMGALRAYIPSLWQQFSLKDKQRFLRHVLPYWNIHRHRIHHEIANVLTQLRLKKQLHILAGRLMSSREKTVNIALRHQDNEKNITIDWMINCMGPSLSVNGSHSPLIKNMLKRGIASLDTLELGLYLSANYAVCKNNGEASILCYALGSLTRGTCWESSAVPELRKQIFQLAKTLLTT